MVAPKMDFGTTGPDVEALPVPYAPAEPGAPAAIAGPDRAVSLQAHLVEGGGALQDGVVWRVFSARPAEDGALALVATARGGVTTVRLAPGDYIVHAGFGRAGATKRVTVEDQDQTASFILNAGGLRLDAVVGEDDPLTADRVRFEIQREDAGGAPATVVPDAEPGRVVRLEAGTYHVISRYGDVNAVVRADIQVEPGKLTEAVMRHTGAEVTLKLVATEGGEALANTSWTVLTESGDTVHESIGAFPSMILAEGNYAAIATHQGRVYSRDFVVETGSDRDIEVRLSDVVPPQQALAPNSGPSPEIVSGPAQQ
ncbi:MAG TPA: hypothetical protein VHG92_07420 [Afifellaceae bacterium]|nr:hypothetical protein [Afifellaceae bacterium]